MVTIFVGIIAALTAGWFGKGLFTPAVTSAVTQNIALAQNKLAAIKAEIVKIEGEAVTDAKAVIARVKAIL